MLPTEWFKTENMIVQYLPYSTGSPSLGFNRWMEWLLEKEASFVMPLLILMLHDDQLSLVLLCVPVKHAPA
jgi:hypothetical protein